MSSEVNKKEARLKHWPVALFLCRRFIQEQQLEVNLIKELVPPRIVEIYRSVEKRSALRILPSCNETLEAENEPPVKKLRVSTDPPSTSSKQQKKRPKSSTLTTISTLDRIADRRKNGAWEATQMPVCEDQHRVKTHWDFLLEEMRWIHLVTRNERLHRRHYSKKMAQWVMRHHTAKANELAKRESTINLEKEAKKHCGQVARMVEEFWSKAQQLVDHFQKQSEEADRRRDLDNKLSIVTAEIYEINKNTNVVDGVSECNGNEEPKKSTLKSNGKRTENGLHSSSDDLEKAAEEAQSFQPKGNTLETADIQITEPDLLEGKLREYQLVGLNWLYALHEKNLNGILADEMGLGKTIQTISLFAHLAVTHSVWGPHLVVVPTSVMLNWEMEFKKWCPSFKILTYYGSVRDRAAKRKGWNTNGSFDICITSYQLFVQDARCFKKKQWQYLVLDEAQHIKNFESQRWQTLINLRTRRRLLLTGTPLQNNLMELWALLHFLLPAVFASRDDFKDWFNNPISDMIEGNEDFNVAVVQRLHRVLRPFILRRLKSEVEKQLPKKTEKVILCDLSKRQRYLYNEFMSLRSTVESLKTGSIVSVLGIVMQLRKCCNHPNLFEPRQVQSPFYVEEGEIAPFCRLVHLERDVFERPDLRLQLQDSISTNNRSSMLKLELQSPERTVEKCDFELSPFQKALNEIATRREEWTFESLNRFILYVPNALYPPIRSPFIDSLKSWWQLYDERRQQAHIKELHRRRNLTAERALTNGMLQFPEVRLIEYDCGKLQTLAALLRNLYAENHRCLIFTQMSKMLDILQAFLSHHGYLYFRLDGSTPVERRQALMERFNSDSKVFCFILSTRAGGTGVNLIGADTVIFYDSDWNPSIDSQAQDRCHRIGQTKDVTIYRLVSRNTIEENILKKAREKRRLGELAIDEAGFTPAFFKKKDNIRDLFKNENGPNLSCINEVESWSTETEDTDIQKAMEKAEDEQDVLAARRAVAEVAADEAEFNFDSTFQAMPEFDEVNMQIWESLQPVEKFAASMLWHHNETDGF
ncbi:hypothetical protein M3Y95_00181100 [Aphelenchoides besseyi]|nr:hypothetical protein M3Y95_00181100 [Aphelenchoides besseyi]